MLQLYPPLEKFVVPSIGSMIQMMPDSVFVESDSSEMMPSLGKACFMAFTIIASDLRSPWVTQPCEMPFFPVVFPFCFLQ